MDSMGRNHGALLRGLTQYFGPDSASIFFTWAGGSQNIRILNGVYGGGVLGEAKAVGEQAAAEYQIDSQRDGFARGVHKISRFPNFESFAIFGIPGAGPYAMISGDVLRSHGVYQSRPQLAAQNLIEMFGGTNNLRNPISQVELDTAETYHMEEIAAKLAEFHRRVKEYQEAHPDWDGKPLDIETSKKLLEGLVDDNYVDYIPKVTK
jgi:hypothetical protein